VVFFLLIKGTWNRINSRIANPPSIAARLSHLSQPAAMIYPATRYGASPCC